MNIRDVYGFEDTKDLYELASHCGVHVGAMDRLVRFAIEIQKRGFGEKAKREGALERMVENELYNEPEKAA